MTQWVYVGCAVAALHRLLTHNLFSGTILICSQILVEQMQGDTGQFSDQRCTGLSRSNFSLNSLVSQNRLQQSCHMEMAGQWLSPSQDRMPCRLSVQSEQPPDHNEHQVNK